LQGYGRTLREVLSLSFLCGNKSLGKGFSFSKSFQALTSNLGYYS
jgi:hypothetical protein